jgi:hypothetical protein
MVGKSNRSRSERGGGLGILDAWRGASCGVALVGSEPILFVASV